MTLWEFCKETFAWLSDQYDAGELNDAIQKMKSVIKLTKEEAKQWWCWAKFLALWGTVASTLLLVVGIAVGWLMGTGYPNALAGLLIAPLLFILLVWWTPLVAIIAVIYELAEFRYRGLPGAAVAKAKSWLGLTCGILLWQVIASLALTFIPYWNAIACLPILMLLALAMALIGIRWGNLPNYRKIIKSLVIGAFVTQVAVCFFPHTATALHNWMGKADKRVAISIETNGILPTRKTNTPPPRDLNWQRWEVKLTTNTVVRVYNGDEFIYKSPSTFKVTEPDGDYFHNRSATPEEVRSFKFYNLPAEGWEIKILPVNVTSVFWLDFRIESRRTL